VTKAALVTISKLESTVIAWKMYPVASGTAFHLKSIEGARYPAVGCWTTNLLSAICYLLFVSELLAS
jgi:hypothetical protein